MTFSKSYIQSVSDFSTAVESPPISSLYGMTVVRYCKKKGALGQIAMFWAW